MSKLFEPPYYAVIFTSQKKEGDSGYDAMASRMEKLSAQQPGYLGVHSARDENGFGITVSYWKTLEDIKNWKSNLEHQKAQAQGQSNWYKDYEVRICQVISQYTK